MKKDSVKTYSYRVSQATRSELIVIMYDMAIEYVEGAKNAYNTDMETYHNELKQAKRVIDELSKSLDMQYEISAQLLQIYVAMMRFIVRANAGKEAEVLDTVLSMLQNLRKSFYEVSKQDNSEPLMKNAQQIYAGLTYSNTGISTEMSGNPGEKRGYTV